jgi:hypothetical protein
MPADEFLLATDIGLDPDDRLRVVIQSGSASTEHCQLFVSDMRGRTHADHSGDPFPNYERYDWAGGDWRRAAMAVVYWVWNRHSYWKDYSAKCEVLAYVLRKACADAESKVA